MKRLNVLGGNFLCNLSLCKSHKAKFSTQCNLFTVSLLPILMMMMMGLKMVDMVVIMVMDMVEIEMVVIDN